MTSEQRATLIHLNHGHFNEKDFAPAFDLPAGWVSGWCKDSEGKPWLYVGVSPEGEASS